MLIVLFPWESVPQEPSNLVSVLGRLALEATNPGVWTTYENLIPFRVTAVPLAIETRCLSCVHTFFLVATLIAGFSHRSSLAFEQQIRILHIPTPTLNLLDMESSQTSQQRRGITCFTRV